MGAGASLPQQIDKEAAKRIAGDAYDDDAFNKAAKDGSVSRDEFLAMAKDKAGGSGGASGRASGGSSSNAAAASAKKSKKSGKAKVSVVQASTTASLLFSKASMARVHAFLLGTHPRAGEESLIRKLAPETLRQILMDVREPAPPAPDLYHFASKVSGGTIDMWAIVSPPPTLDSLARGNQLIGRPRVVMQHSDGDAGRKKGPAITRYLGVYEELHKFDAQIRFTHKAIGVKPSCPPGATAEELPLIATDCH